jgi:hypothetical protein
LTGGKEFFNGIKNISAEPQKTPLRMRFRVIGKS